MGRFLSLLLLVLLADAAPLAALAAYLLWWRAQREARTHLLKGWGHG